MKGILMTAGSVYRTDCSVIYYSKDNKYLIYLIYLDGGAEYSFAEYPYYIITFCDARPTDRKKPRHKEPAPIVFHCPHPGVAQQRSGKRRYQFFENAPGGAKARSCRLAVSDPLEVFDGDLRAMLEAGLFEDGRYMVAHSAVRQEELFGDLGV